MNLRRRAALLGAWLLVAAGSGYAEGLPLWQVDGSQNRVYLLGSVHLLREADYPLPAEIGAAYVDAETLVMELDMDDLDPDAAAALMAELGLLAAGDSLPALLGAEAWQRAEALAAEANVPLATLARTEPWLAALSIEQFVLTRLGFSAEFGVESHFTRLAGGDGKPVLGLETLREQLDILDGLPLAVQRDLMLQTLEESTDLAEIMDRLLAAWRRGDTAALERTLLADLRRHPALYEALVAERNRRWLAQLEDMLSAQDDYLVIVGTLHLVGEDGLPQLLERRGHRPRQLEGRD